MSSVQTFTAKDTDDLELARFREMDYFVVEEFGIPVELMMENAGLHLATLVSKFADMSDLIQIGVGNGNNGGGGLVAARRLAGWGYKVVLDLPVKISKELPQLQMRRALKFGAIVEPTNNPDIWVDAYLGFSQQLPLSKAFQDRVHHASKTNCLKFSLDIPTGFLGNSDDQYFQADNVLSLAASKKILRKLPSSTNIYLADIGIPKAIYKRFGSSLPPFNKSTILKIEK